MNQDFLRNILVAGLGGLCVYFFFVVGVYGIDDVKGDYVLQSFGYGCLAGFIIGALDQLSGGGLPLLNSWVALAVCVFIIMPMLRSPRGDDLFWTAFIYGYAAHLVWQGYHGKLQKF